MHMIADIWTQITTPPSASFFNTRCHFSPSPPLLQLLLLLLLLLLLQVSLWALPTLTLTDRLSPHPQNHHWPPQAPIWLGGLCGISLVAFHRSELLLLQLIGRLTVCCRFCVVAFLDTILLPLICFSQNEKKKGQVSIKNFNVFGNFLLFLSLLLYLRQHSLVIL